MRKGLADDTPFEDLRVGVKAQKQTAPKWLTGVEFSYTYGLPMTLFSVILRL